MNVALDARYVREKPSGIGTYVQALLDRLPALAPADRFLFWAHPLAPRPLSPAPNTSDRTVAPGPNSPLPVWWPSRYGSFDGIDVFHSPHNMMPRALPCASVVTVHDVMSIERPDLHLQGLERAVKGGYYKRAVWRALTEATRIITPSQDVAERIGRLAPEAEGRVRVIHEAADPIFQPSRDPKGARAAASVLIGSTAPYFLVVGANARTKRHADAVAAFAAVPEPWKLVLLQRQGAQRALASLAQSLGIAERVVWIPRVTRQDVVTLIQSAGALVQPSLYEGFGLPVIEAMASGCPVVASDIQVFREVAGDAAIFVPAGTPQALGLALRALAESVDQRAALTARGLARATAFSWDACAAETLRVYRDAMEAVPLARGRRSA
jgi:glycosyltransferase involved in cell wall biosynthesis